MAKQTNLLHDIKKSSLSVFGISYKRLFGLVLAVTFFAIYVGVLLFGENSFNQYVKLQEQKLYYQNLVQELKMQNAKLQKDYFELKEVQPKELKDN